MKYGLFKPMYLCDPYCYENKIQPVYAEVSRYSVGQRVCYPRFGSSTCLGIAKYGETLFETSEEAEAALNKRKQKHYSGSRFDSKTSLKNSGKHNIRIFEIKTACIFISKNNPPQIINNVIKLRH